MQSWSAPSVPTLPLRGPAVSVHDTASGAAALTDPGPEARLYVCGITPYDATHLGHAATFVGFDLLHRAWRNAGHSVHYVQNVTDVDDPLLERAARDGVDWAVLAEREIALFRGDMTALRVLPPRHYVGVVESIALVIGEVEALSAAGATYVLDGDVYQAVAEYPGLGAVSRLSREEMLPLFAERGGDPGRAGKQDPLDPLIWRAERPGEPAWDSPWGRGRPGWHIECAAIARAHLGTGFDVQAGGNDLRFPHHEMSAIHAEAAHPGESFAHAYVHAGMVGYAGQKMSKSLGNLVLVSRLTAAGEDPMAIRLALSTRHYREDWEWTDDLLIDATKQLATWREATARPAGAESEPALTGVLARLADDLDAPGAVRVVQEWAESTLAGAADEPGAPQAVRSVIDAALGIAL
jgi:L-cysteine:1D-myo-inositol 2-amino-2-deoxy-alpha-D-glucopyranoside ligase